MRDTACSALDVSRSELCETYGISRFTSESLSPALEAFLDKHPEVYTNEMVLAPLVAHTATQATRAYLEIDWAILAKGYADAQERVHTFWDVSDKEFAAIQERRHARKR